MPAAPTRCRIEELLASLRSFWMLANHLYTHGRPRAVARELATRLSLRYCPQFPRDRRSWAHVGHVGRAICLRRGFPALPRAVQVGILAHEIGHLLGKPGSRPRPPRHDILRQDAEMRRIYPDRTPAQRLDEAVANWRAATQLGVPIRYDRWKRQTSTWTPKTTTR